MKFLIFALLVTSGSALAYTSSTVGNDPVKDPAWVPEKRDPASMPVKEKSGKIEMKKDHKTKK